MLLALQAWAANAFAPVSSSAGSKTVLDMMEKASPGYTSKTAEWDMRQISPMVRIEGQSRHTWNFYDDSREIVQVAFDSEGRPLNADIQLWVGPDWTPMKIICHSENGQLYPVQTLVGTRNKCANIEIRNTGPHVMPFNAVASYAIPPLSEVRTDMAEAEKGRYIEGGSVYMFSFPSEVDQMAVLLKTDGMQLNAKIELLNGPNNVKMQYEVFTNNGLLNALYIVFDCPGAGNSIRIKNLAPFEFPCRCFTQETIVEAKAGPMTWDV